MKCEIVARTFGGFLEDGLERGILDAWRRREDAH